MEWNKDDYQTQDFQTNYNDVLDKPRRVIPQSLLCSYNTQYGEDHHNNNNDEPIEKITSIGKYVKKI